MRFLPLLICGLLSFSVYSQNGSAGGGFNPSANNVDRLVICPALKQPTAMPFLSFGGNCFIRSIDQIRVVAPEMDAIINSSQNPALLQQAKPYKAVKLDYTPWQTDFTASTDYALKVSLQKQFRKGGSLELQYENFAVAPHFGFFVKDEFSFTPQMHLTRLAYARAISKHWSLGVAAKYVSQSLPNDWFFFQTIQSAKVIAADIGFKYQNSKALSDYQQLSWQWGFSLSNVGSKVDSEIDNDYLQPLPTLLSAGFLVEQTLLLPQTASLRIRGAYQVNKLLTPAFCDACDENFNAVPDYLEHSALKGMLVSFTDAPGGLGEELQEVNHQLDMGATYMFNDKFGLRAQLTLFYQHPDKGNLQYLATQLGMQQGKIQLNFTYYSPFFQADSGRMGISLGYQHFLSPS